jgi:hypothetical protein
MDSDGSGRGTGSETRLLASRTHLRARRPQNIPRSTVSSRGRFPGGSRNPDCGTCRARSGRFGSGVRTRGRRGSGWPPSGTCRRRSCPRWSKARDPMGGSRAGRSGRISRRRARASSPLDASAPRPHPRPRRPCTLRGCRSPPRAGTPSRTGFRRNENSMALRM